MTFNGIGQLVRSRIIVTVNWSSVKYLILIQIKLKKFSPHANIFF